MGSFPFKYQINKEKLGRTRNHTQNSGKHRNPVCELFQCFRKTFNLTDTELHTLQGSLSGLTQRRPPTEHLCFPGIHSNNILERSENIQAPKPQCKIIYWDFHVTHKIHMAPQKPNELHSSKLGQMNFYWSAGCPQNSPRICPRTSDWT